MDISALNFDYILNNKEKELINLSNSVVEEIIERTYKLNNQKDLNLKIEFLIKLKQCKSPFQLIDLEKRRIT